MGIGDLPRVMSLRCHRSRTDQGTDQETGLSRPRERDYFDCRTFYLRVAFAGAAAVAGFAAPAGVAPDGFV